MPRGGTRGKLVRGVRARHRGAPTLADLEQAGLGLDSDEIRQVNPDGWFYDGKDWRCVLWAENWPAMKFYLEIMDTQWRPDYIGLDYNVLLRELDRRSLDREEYDDLFAAVRVIERTTMAERHKD